MILIFSPKLAEMLQHWRKWQISTHQCHSAYQLKPKYCKIVKKTHSTAIMFSSSRYGQRFSCSFASVCDSYCRKSSSNIILCIYLHVIYQPSIVDGGRRQRTFSSGKISWLSTCCCHARNHSMNPRSHYQNKSLHYLTLSNFEFSNWKKCTHRKLIQLK